MFIIMLFQIIKYAGFSATSNRPIDDIRGGKNDICAWNLYFSGTKNIAQFFKIIFSAKSWLSK